MLKDQSELLAVLNEQRVDYLVIGGHAVGAHGVARLTKDMDILLRDTPENGLRAYRALAAYGAPIAGYTASDFSGHPERVIQFGVPPGRIDILQNIEGVDIDQVFANQVTLPVTAELSAPFISLQDLIKNKETVGRLQDLADVEGLRKIHKKF